MSKQTFALLFYVLLITVANIYLWVAIVQEGPAPRSGKFVGLIVMLALGAVFSDKFSHKQFASTLIRAGSLIGMTVVFFILLNR